MSRARRRGLLFAERAALAEVIASLIDEGPAPYDGNGPPSAGAARTRGQSGSPVFDLRVTR